MARDMRVINRVLGIMQHEEQILFRKSDKWRVTRKDLADMMLTTRNRSDVTYDLKSEFPNISHNEIMECIDNAAEMYLSYLELRTDSSKVSHPTLRFPRMRRMGYRRFKLDLDQGILSIIDSRQTNYEMIVQNQTTTRHNYLDLPVVIHDRLLEYYERGPAKSVVITEDDGKYYANIIFNIEVAQWQPHQSHPLALIGVDLGINKTIAAVLYTTSGIIERKVFHDSSAKSNYDNVDQQISSLHQQRHLRSISRYIDIFRDFRSKIASNSIRSSLTNLLDQLYSGNSWDHAISQLKQDLCTTSPISTSETQIYNNIHKNLLQLQQYGTRNSSNVTKRLKLLRHKRSQIKTDMLNKLCHQIQEYIVTTRTKYNLYVCVGDVSGIRQSARKENSNPWLRKKVNLWAYDQLSRQLTHNMTKIGMSNRLISVSESWTSIICYKCSSKGMRPKQHLFKCRNTKCNLQINADHNGAANIAKRGVIKRNLLGSEELEKWNISTKFVSGKY